MVNRLLNSDIGHAYSLTRKDSFPACFPACFSGDATILKWIKSQMMPKRKRSGVKLKKDWSKMFYFQKKAGNLEVAA